MRDVFLLSFVLALLPFVFVKPHVGILLWTWVSYMYPQRLSWGFMYDFPIAMLIGAVTLLAWLVSRERKAPPGDAVTVLIFILAVWVSITTIFALVPDVAFPAWDRKMKALVMTVVTIIVMGTRERLHALIWIMVVSLGYFGAKGGLFTLLGAAESRVLGPPGSFIADNNSISLALIMIVPLIRYLQLQSQVWWIRVGLYGAMLLTLLGIIGTYSRGALLGMIAMLMVMAARSRRRALIFGAGLAVAVFALAFTPERWIERMQSIVHYEEDGSVQGRFDAWKFAFKLALDRPIVGGGFEANWDDERFFRYVPDAAKVRSFHSIVFEMLGEHGWIGLSLYIALLIAAVNMSRGIERRARDRPDLVWARDLATMVQASMAGFIVTGLSQDHAFFDVYTHVLAIIAVTHGIVRSETAPAPATGATSYRQTPGAIARGAPLRGGGLGRGR